MSEDTSIKLTPLDLIAGGGQLQMMKALLPYIAKPGQQQFMALFIKTMEINNIMSFYQQPQSDSDVSTASISPMHKSASTLEMLQDIRDFLPSGEQSMIDQFLNMFQMMEMVNTFQNMENGNTDDMLKNLLSPEQQAMFETYQSMI